MSYEILARSRIGAFHRYKYLPNQDDWKKIYLYEKSWKTWVIAVADGHGSSDCPYSQFGSKFAARVFCDTIREIYNSSTDSKEFTFKLTSTRLEILPKDIIKKWKGEIKENFYILSNSNQHTINKEENDQDIQKKYGTTLLGLVFTEEFFLAMQVGDGDIITVYQDETVEKVFEGKKYFGVETDSMASKNAWSLFSNEIRHFSPENRPLCYMLSTDGLSNSYVDDEAFMKVSIDLIGWYREGKLKKDRLYRALDRISKLGSGDDITLAIAIDKELT